MSDTTRTRTWSAEAISCDHCKHAIESEVATVPGVESVEVDIAEKKITVRGDAPDDAVVAAIDEAGYDAVPA